MAHTYHYEREAGNSRRYSLKFDGEATSISLPDEEVKDWFKTSPVFTYYKLVHSSTRQMSFKDLLYKYGEWELNGEPVVYYVSDEDDKQVLTVNDRYQLVFEDGDKLKCFLNGKLFTVWKAIGFPPFTNLDTLEKIANDIGALDDDKEEEQKEKTPLRASVSAKKVFKRFDDLEKKLDNALELISAVLDVIDTRFPANAVISPVGEVPAAEEIEQPFVPQKEIVEAFKFGDGVRLDVKIGSETRSLSFATIDDYKDFRSKRYYDFWKEEGYPLWTIDEIENNYKLQKEVEDCIG